MRPSRRDFEDDAVLVGAADRCRAIEAPHAVADQACLRAAAVFSVERVENGLFPVFPQGRIGILSAYDPAWTRLLGRG
jgi:hypothetical protein